MLSYTTVQSLGQIRLEEMHEQARRAALAKIARRARRAQRTRAVLAGADHPHATGGFRAGWQRRQARA